MDAYTLQILAVAYMDQLRREAAGDGLSHRPLRHRARRTRGRAPSTTKGSEYLPTGDKPCVER